MLLLTLDNMSELLNTNEFKNWFNNTFPQDSNKDSDDQANIDQEENQEEPQITSAQDQPITSSSLNDINQTSEAPFSIAANKHPVGRPKGTGAKPTSFSPANRKRTQEQTKKAKIEKINLKQTSSTFLNKVCTSSTFKSRSSNYDDELEEEEEEEEEEQEEESYQAKLAYIHKSANRFKKRTEKTKAFMKEIEEEEDITISLFFIKF